MYKQGMITQVSDIFMPNMHEAYVLVNKDIWLNF